MKTDVLIVGSGCSGLYCALNLPRDIEITIITKSDLESNDSYLAQGGMCMLKEAADYESFFEDTLKAGHYENDRKSEPYLCDKLLYQTALQSDPSWRGSQFFSGAGA